MSFFFSYAEIPHPEGDAKLACWLPVPEEDVSHYEGGGRSRGSAAVTVELDDEVRTALQGPVAMAFLYNSQFSRRVQLGHDCGVFALSCESGDPLTDADFNGQTRDTVYVKSIGEPWLLDGTEEGRSEPGSLVLLDSKAGTPHIVVHATTDGGEPLYVSKIGSEGPVILSDGEQIADLYDAAYAAVVTDLSPA